MKIDKWEIKIAIIDKESVKLQSTSRSWSELLLEEVKQLATSTLWNCNQWKKLNQTDDLKEVFCNEECTLNWEIGSGR